MSGFALDITKFKRINLQLGSNLYYNQAPFPTIQNNSYYNLNNRLSEANEFLSPCFKINSFGISSVNSRASYLNVKTISDVFFIANTSASCYIQFCPTTNGDVNVNANYYLSSFSSGQQDKISLPVKNGLEFCIVFAYNDATNNLIFCPIE